MDAKLKGLYDQKQTEIDASRAIAKRAKDDGDRAMTAEERTQADAHLDKALDLDKQIREYQADRERERKLVELEDRAQRGEPSIDDPSPRDPKELRRDSRGRIVVPREEREAFDAYVRAGREGNLSEVHRRALQADGLSSGGALILPLALSGIFTQNVDDMTFMRRLATVERVEGAESLGVPGLGADPSDADWTGEVVTVNEDSQMSFVRRELQPRPNAKALVVSKTLLRRSPRAGSIVLERLAYKHAISQENAFLNGTGANQPLGVFTANAQGISTARDVATGNTTTAISATGLVAALMSLKEQHRRMADWVVGRTFVQQAMLLVGSDGQFLWQTSLRDDTPDRLLGRPVNVSEYVPSTFTTGLYVGVIGAFKAGYVIGEALAVQIQRLVELRALSNQDVFVGRGEVDGMPVLEEAFARVKLG
jgi:HK97 family phage major capsid protein